ncbi:NAD(P)-dependent alcohol dehydrogenase [Burkholderia guangdongensis]|uniref:NAD(P)-dependent alcohol dehydrogenase n=1 Tax=Burkholderia guangdongensis TaxID=1792500 RepID=UPI0015CCFF60|nr:NAD(P)-dependent alcohol dehydrogenase [Burkholderia guangdongensis]
MKAVRLFGVNDVRVVDVDRPVPKPGEVLVKVAAAGVCHSDLHLIEHGRRAQKQPFTLGHENAGWVEQLGDGVDGFEIGEPVMVFGPWGCGHCAPCQASFENYCEHQSESPVLGGGLGTDGGMAEYMIVPHPRLLVKLGDLAPGEVAPLSDAALTPYHAIKRSAAKLTPSSFVFVIGIGGLGHMAVQILKKLYAATVIAGDIADDKLDVARHHGADHVVRTDRPDAAEQIRALTGSKKCAVVLDFVGAAPTLALGAATVGLNGDFTVVGLAGGHIDYAAGVVPWGASLCVPYWGSRVELMEVLDMKRKGIIDIDYTTYPLERANDVYQMLREGRINGRAVLVPSH